jgi:hypothetical protein
MSYGKETFLALIGHKPARLHWHEIRDTDPAGVYLKRPTEEDIRLGFSNPCAHPTGNPDAPALPFPFTALDFAAFEDTAGVVAQMSDDELAALFDAAPRACALALRMLRRNGDEQLSAPLGDARPDAFDRWLILPEKALFVRWREIARMITAALHGDLDEVELDEEADFIAGFKQEAAREEIQESVDSAIVYGQLTILNPLSRSPVKGNVAIQDGLVSRGDLVRFVEQCGIGVRTLKAMPTPPLQPAGATAKPHFVVGPRPTCVPAALMKLDASEKVSFEYNYAGRHTSGTTNADDLRNHVGEIVQRQSEGYFTLEEAAQVLADSRPGLDPRELVGRFRLAHKKGALPIHHHRSRLPMEAGETVRDFADLLETGELDAWLRASRAGYGFPNSEVREESTTVRFSPFARLESKRPFTGGRIASTDFLELKEAAEMASVHAGCAVTVNDIIRAASRAEISIWVKYPRNAVMRPQEPDADSVSVPAGCLCILPWSGAQALANTGVARWRTIDGVRTHDEVALIPEGHIGFFDKWALPPEEPDLEARPEDCRINGHYLSALADALSEFASTGSAQEEERRVKPLQAFPAQEGEILKVIRLLGHDPKKLPRRQPGKLWVKSDVWSKIGVCQLFASEKVFNKAWERLRSSAEIAERAGL